MKEKSLNPDGKLYCDTRLGGIKRWYYGKPEDADMRIPRDAVRSVCFLCVKATDRNGMEYDHFIGTGFFINFRDKTLIGGGRIESGSLFVYLVTAKHVISDAKAEGYSQFYVRLNKRAGGSETIPIPDEWEVHENPGVDVAVLPFRFTYDIFDHYSLPTDHFDFMLFEWEMNWLDIGIGDDLFVTGLFSHRWGEQRNIPIVRSGILAAMPDEPLVDEDGNLYYAYLAEMRSIGGLSGSPVYVLRYPQKPSVQRQEIEDDFSKFVDFLNDRFDDTPTTHFLGMIRGHWDLKRQGEDSVYREADAREIDRLNTGIAYITPAWDILAVLEKEALMKQREQADKERRKETAPTQDSNLPPKSKGEGITQEGYMDALKRASRKIAPDEETKEDAE